MFIPAGDPNMSGGTGTPGGGTTPTGGTDAAGNNPGGSGSSDGTPGGSSISAGGNQTAGNNPGAPGFGGTGGLTPVPGSTTLANACANGGGPNCPPGIANPSLLGGSAVAANTAGSSPLTGFSPVANAAQDCSTPRNPAACRTIG